MPFARVNDIKMHYQILNSQAEADTIVLIHGLGLNMELWEAVIPFFVQHYRLLIFDVRGHGKTERGTSPLSWELFVEDIHQLLQQLLLKSVHLVGHGFGGNLALKYSLLYKENVQTLSLIAAPAFYPQKSVDALIESRKHLSRSGSILPLAQSMAKRITLEPSDSYFFQKIVAAYNIISPEFYFQVFDLYLASPPNTDFQSIVHPTLSILGSFDPIYLTSYTVSSKLVVKTRLLVMPSASNAVFIDQPQLTVNWIHDFISTPVLDNDNGTFETNTTESIMRYFHEVYEEGIHKIDSLEVMQIDFLSAFRVSINGEERLEGWNQRYAKSLLLFLTFNQSTTREQICDTLFPLIPLRQAMNNLKVYLNYLRKLLESPASQQSILMTDKEHIALRSSIRSDVLELKNNLRKAHIEQDASLKLIMSREIFSSLPDTLLPGIYDDWIIDYRTALENQIVELAKEASAIEQEKGNIHDSIHFLNIALKYHPEDEFLYDQSIELYEQLKQGVRDQRNRNSKR